MDKPKKKEVSSAAIILAAGEGRRIGMPKWQIEYGGKTFLEIILQKLRGVFFDSIICVKRESFDIKMQGLSFVNNVTPELGMVSSLFYAFQANPDFDGYLILPVDHPFIESETISKLSERFRYDSKVVVRPVYNSTPGHPIIIPNFVAARLVSPDYEGGLRQLIKDLRARIINVEVNDPNILKNVNCISDL